MRYFELFEDKSPKAREIILQKYGEQMTQKIKTDPHDSNMSSSDLLDFIIKNDPTSKSIYTDWVLKMYINGSIRYIEDISKVFEPLSFYEKLKNKLPVDQRDINKFKSFRDFDAFIDKHRDTDVRSNNEQEKEYENQLIKSGQAEIFYNSPNIKIIIPHTEEASMYFGKNTKWCTSAKNDNMFEQYNKKGPLYIILFKKENKRWQFHFETNQFMDELDNELSDKEVKSVLPLFKLNYEELINKNEKLIRFISNPSEELQLAAVKKNGNAIKFINNPSEEIQLAAVKTDGNAIQWIENPSEELQIAAVKKNAYAIKFINNPSEAVQLAAVQLDGYSIQYIKNPSEKVQMIAVKQDGYSIQWIENPSEKAQLAAVQENGSSIYYIKNPSEAVQLAAIQKNGHVIDYIDNPSEAVQLAAVKKDRNSIDFIKNPTQKVLDYLKNK